MELQFTPPPIKTRDEIGAVDLAAAFRLTLDLSERKLEATVRGRRIHQRITGGTINGPRLEGQVYPFGGGEFGLVRADETEELLGRFMINATNGEWLYAHIVGYSRADGYARCQAMFDADAQGPHAWLNESMFIGSLKEQPDRRRRTIALFEVI